MKYTSCRGIIIKDGKIAVMEREKKGRKYCTFPGGHVEEGETDEECVVRELQEEFGIKTKPKKLIYAYENNGVYQAFFVMDWLSGEISKTDAEEYQENASGMHNPTLIPLSEMKSKNLMPPEVTEQLEEDLKIFGTNLNRDFILLHKHTNNHTNRK